MVDDYLMMVKMVKMMVDHRYHWSKPWPVSPARLKNNFTRRSEVGVTAIGSWLLDQEYGH